MICTQVLIPKTGTPDQTRSPVPPPDADTDGPAQAQNKTSLNAETSVHQSNNLSIVDDLYDSPDRETLQHAAMVQAQQQRQGHIPKTEAVSPRQEQSAVQTGTISAPIDVDKLDDLPAERRLSRDRSLSQVPVSAYTDASEGGVSIGVVALRMMDQRMDLITTYLMTLPDLHQLPGLLMQRGIPRAFVDAQNEWADADHTTRLVQLMLVTWLYYEIQPVDRLALMRT